jgi:hypothetical protein
MSMHGRGRSAAAAGVISLVFWAASAAQTAADPWKKVPTAPTSCYPDDGFEGLLAKASADVEAEITRQGKLNAEIQKAFDAMDMGEKARRMQAFMMKNPQEGMRMLLAQREAATSIGSSMGAANADGERLDQEFARYKAKFSGAVESALKPIKAKQAEMYKTRTRPAEAEREWLTPADKAQYGALIQQENAEYEKVCATYFAASGLFPVWLKNYRTKVIEPGIAAAETSEAAVVLQMKIMDTPTGGYRPTAPLEGVRDYLGKLGSVYSLRHHKARAE